MWIYTKNQRETKECWMKWRKTGKRGKDRRIFLMKLLMKFVAEQRGKLRMVIDTALME